MNKAHDIARALKSIINDEIHVFVCYTARHLDFCDKIIQQNAFRNTIIINHFNSRKSKHASLTINPVGRILAKILKIRKVFSLINSWRKKNVVKVYIPHTSGILANGLYVKSQRWGLKINLYYDGVLSLYNYSESEKEGRRAKYILQRKALSALVGIRYKPFDNIVPCFDKHIARYYTPIPEYTIGAIAKQKIEWDKISYKPKEGVSLILGQLLYDYSEEEIIDLFNYIFSQIDSTETIYFKKHPADTRCYDDILSQHKVRCQLIEDTEAIENLIVSYAPSTVISFTSSGLLNLKICLTNNVKLVSYLVERKLNHDRNIIRDVFTKVGIDVRIVT